MRYMCRSENDTKKKKKKKKKEKKNTVVSVRHLCPHKQTVKSWAAKAHRLA